MHRYNPAGVKVKVYEMPHEPERFSARGGPNTGDHVDILGRQSLNELILRVAAGKGDEVGENVESAIRTYAERVKITEELKYM
jgi:phospholipid:diacylglycerol acyltransferase